VESTGFDHYLHPPAAIMELYLHDVFDGQLANELSCLFTELRSDPNFIGKFHELALALHNGGWPEDVLVDSIIDSSLRGFHCPFPHCAKTTSKPQGWSCIRNVRDHVFIHHLGRRILCTIKEWYG